MSGFSFSTGVQTLANESMPIFAGIVTCKIVYEITGWISSSHFKSYANLSEMQRVEWKNRGFSTFHALLAAAVSFYLLVFSDLFQDDSHDDLFINRHSTVSDTMLGVSSGYFLADLGMILWFFPDLGGKEYIVVNFAATRGFKNLNIRVGTWSGVMELFVGICFRRTVAANLKAARDLMVPEFSTEHVLHHCLSMYSILLSLMSGQGQIYILMVLFTEITTPFVNLRWCLDVAGQKNSKVYVHNGVALFFGWLVARVLLFIFFFTHMYLHFDQVKMIFPLGFYCLLTVPPLLTFMNLFWFWKILKGLIKTLSKAKRRS